MSTETTTLDAAARAVLDRVYAGWADNDADALVEPYADSVTATLPGLQLVGREAVRANMRESFAGGLKGSRAVLELEQARRLGPAAETLLVHTRSAIVFAGSDEPAAGTWARDTWVLSRHGDSWLVESYQSSPLAAG